MRKYKIVKVDLPVGFNLKSLDMRLCFYRHTDRVLCVHDGTGFVYHEQIIIYYLSVSLSNSNYFHNLRQTILVLKSNGVTTIFHGNQPSQWSSEYSPDIPSNESEIAIVSYLQQNMSNPLSRLGYRDVQARWED
jgi:hypothetical protein